MTRRHALLLAGAGAGAALAGAGFAWWRYALDKPRIEADFWTLRFDRPEGGELALASLRGRPLVLNFWATWCPPCLKEMPDLDRLHGTHAARGLQVVGLAVEGPTPVRQFLARQPVRFAIGLAGLDGTALSRRLGNSNGGLPFTVVFDSQGRLRHRKLGQTSYDELDRWVRGL